MPSSEVHCLVPLMNSRQDTVSVTPHTVSNAPLQPLSQQQTLVRFPALWTVCALTFRGNRLIVGNMNHRIKIVPHHPTTQRLLVLFFCGSLGNIHFSSKRKLYQAELCCVLLGVCCFPLGTSISQRDVCAGKAASLEERH